MRFVHFCLPAAPKRGCAARWRSSKTSLRVSRSQWAWGQALHGGWQASNPKRAMKIDVLTLFPAMFVGPLDESIIMRARRTGLLDLKVHNLRDHAHDRHKTVDDRPFGGGPGMLLKPEPLFEAVEELAREST